MVTTLMRAALLALALLSGLRADDTGTWVEVVATAYSPGDAIDADYRAAKGDRWRWITADARTDVREQPYGIAVPRTGGGPAWPYGTQVIIPQGFGYLDRSATSRTFVVDDTGGRITRMTRMSGILHVDLRYRDSWSARRWGTRRLWIFVLTGKHRTQDMVVSTTNAPRMQTMVMATFHTVVPAVSRGEQTVHPQESPEFPVKLTQAAAILALMLAMVNLARRVGHTVHN